jgi:hypothetical protein
MLIVKSKLAAGTMEEKVMQTINAIMETYERASESERCEMWLAYRGLRPQFEAIELTGKKEGEPMESRFLARFYRNCRRLIQLSPAVR